jgi:hypothetical protein
MLNMVWTGHWSSASPESILKHSCWRSEFRPPKLCRGEARHGFDVWFGRALSSWASAVLFDTPRATPVSEIGESFGVTLSSSATKQNLDYGDVTSINEASTFLPQPAKSKVNE